MEIIAFHCFFSIMVWTLSENVFMFYNYGFNEDTFRIFSKSIGSMAYCFTGGIVFAISKMILIDVDKNLLISRYHVGIFSRDVKSNVPKLEYVSVFLDEKQNHQVNLWCFGNKHYKMYTFDEKEIAFKLANQVAEKLKIDVLDATEKGNNKWIEKSKR